VQAKTARALQSSSLAEIAQTVRLPTANGGSVLDGLRTAVRRAASGDTLLLIGSHYVVGEFLENFQRTGRVITDAE
jgi:folylpolyglutamate synthase/dihydropteroate synthase